MHTSRSAHMHLRALGATHGIGSKIGRQSGKLGFKGGFDGAGVIGGKRVLRPQHGLSPGASCRRGGKAFDLRQHALAKPRGFIGWENRPVDRRGWRSLKPVPCSTAVS